MVTLAITPGAGAFGHIPWQRLLVPDRTWCLPPSTTATEETFALSPPSAVPASPAAAVHSRRPPAPAPAACLQASRGPSHEPPSPAGAQPGACHVAACAMAARGSPSRHGLLSYGLLASRRHAPPRSMHASSAGMVYQPGSRHAAAPVDGVPAGNISKPRRPPRPTPHPPTDPHPVPAGEISIFSSYGPTAQCYLLDAFTGNFTADSNSTWGEPACWPACLPAGLRVCLGLKSANRTGTCHREPAAIRHRAALVRPTPRLPAPRAAGSLSACYAAATLCAGTLSCACRPRTCMRHLLPS